MKAKQIPLRQYSRKQVAAFLREDALGVQTARIVKRFLASDGHTERYKKEKQAA